MLAGIFDGVLANLVWHLGVILLYPILLYIVTIACTAHFIRGHESIAARFEKHSVDNQYLNMIRVFGNGILMVLVGLLGVAVCLPAFILTLVRFLIEIVKAIPSLCCYCFV